MSANYRVSIDTPTVSVQRNCGIFGSIGSQLLSIKYGLSIEFVLLSKEAFAKILS